MAAISAALVKELRQMSGAGMMDCKKALSETDGDIQKAMDILREKGLGKAAKKSDRLASEGLISVVVSDDFKVATMTEINSETDFVAKNENFINLTKKVTEFAQACGSEDIDEIKTKEIEGVTFEEFFNTQIATIGENLVFRRVATIKAKENGVVNGYAHSNGRVGVILAAACENEEVAKKAAPLLKNIAMHAAAMKPKYISYKELDPEFVEKETLALKAEVEKQNEELKRLGKTLKHVPKYASRLQLTDEVLAEAKKELEEALKAQGKPEKIWDRIIPGQMERFIADNTLLDQELTLLSQFYVMDDKKTVEQVLEEKSKEFGGKIEIVEYVRFELGEGLEKKGCDFAAEVAEQLK